MYDATRVPSTYRRSIIAFSMSVVLIIGSLLVFPGCDQIGGGDDDDGPPEEAIVSYSDVNQYFVNQAPAPQTLQVDGDEGSTVTTEGGMILKFPAGAFADAGGNSVSGTVEVEVREAFTLEDMFNSNLTSQGVEGRPLVTGGMFDVDFTQSDSEVTLRDSANVTMPRMTNMGEFRDGTTLWTADRPSPETSPNFVNTGGRAEICTFSPSNEPAWCFPIFGPGWKNMDIWWNRDLCPLTVEPSDFPGDLSNFVVYVISTNPASSLKFRSNGSGGFVRSGGDGIPCSEDYTVIGLGIAQQDGQNVQYFGMKNISMGTTSQTETLGVVPTSTSNIQQQLQGL